jgi:electron transport complex protein RnfA
MINTALFVIFTGFSANLIIQFALGVSNIIGTEQYEWKQALYQGFTLFFSTAITWLAFSFLIIPLGIGFLETLLLLPLSIFFASIIEKGILFLSSKWIRPVHTSVFSAYNGLVFGAAFFVLRSAESFSQVLIMAAGFSLGYILSMAIILEIYKRSSIEAVPAALRGAPLLLISLGLLSLVCSAAAVFFLQMVELF